MTFITESKPSMAVVFLLVSLAATLIVLACRTEARTSSEVGLVWESWGIIKSSYVGGDTLDSKQVAGNMIVNMLEAGEKPAYPFLTELEDLRGRRPRDVPKELTDVWRAWTIFRERWPGVDTKLLADAAIEGMLDSLGDDSAAHLTPEAYDRAQERLSGTYEGIGAFVTAQEDKIVLFPMDGSPALRAGLEAGDAMLEVDGESVVGKSDQEIVEQVRGPSGTKVSLLVERAGEEDPVRLEVFRGDIEMVSLERSLLPGAIGYIYISDFLGTTPDEVLDVLEQLKQVDMLALILDLRSNSGGSIEAGQKVASQFLSDGLFMYEIDKDGTRTNWPIEEGGITSESLPMVVIVNGLTSSVAEAMAGAFQDANRAKILGTTTLGKGSNSVFKELSDGSALYIPVSRWYTPLGRPIQGTGIEPDIKVDLTVEDRNFEIDSQLNEAYEYLDSLLPRFR